MPCGVISRPRRFEAVQWTGHNYSEVRKFLGENVRIKGMLCKHPSLIIYTNEIDECIPVDWWIVREGCQVKPYRPDEFELTFDIEIEHLWDTTCSWELEELGGRRHYTLAPGYTRNDLTPYERQLLERSEEYEKRKG